MPRKATHFRSSAAILLAGFLVVGAASPAFAAPGGPTAGNANIGNSATGTTGAGNIGAGSVPAEFPTLSTEPALAQRQAVGCSIVGLGLTGLALATGMAATSGGAAAASGPMVAELLAYFGAGCTMGAFIATAFPMGNATPDTTPARLPDGVRPAQLLRLRVESAELP